MLPRMKVTSLGEAFKLVMDHADWSGSRLARELGASQPWISMVLRGRRDPGMSRSTELLAKVGWELQLVPTREDPVKRHEFLLAAASVVFVPTATTNPYSSPDYLDTLTHRLAYNELQMGGAPLAREAVRHAVRVTTTAIDGKSPALHAAASRVCRQAALVLHDVRQFDRAEELAATALMFARRAADQVAQVQALDTLSLICAHLPDGRGAEYARRGLAVAGVGDEHRAVLSARLGRSLALTPGQGRQACQSLECAIELSEGCGSLTVEIAGNVGIGFGDLGMPGRAEPHLATAVRLTPTAPFTHSLYLARQAKTAIRARNPDLAADRIATLANVSPLVDSPRLRIHERHIFDATRRWDSVPVVADAREALREAVIR